jgi:hypothetical protein
MTLDDHAHRVRDRSAALAYCLDSYWRLAEEQLSGFHITEPVTYFYPEHFDDQSDPNSCYRLHLGLRLIAGKWRICHGSTDYSCDPVLEEEVPILESSLRARVEAVEHLPGLIQEVVKATEASNHKIDSAIRTAAEALSGECGSANLLAQQLGERGSHLRYG